MFNVFRRSLTVIRQSAGSYIGGLWVQGQDSTLNILASVQGTDAEILQTLPEGYRTSETYTLFTDTQLLTAVTDVANADIVVINNENYQVVKVTAWQNVSFPTKHYEVVVVKENVDQ